MVRLLGIDAGWCSNVLVNREKKNKDLSLRLQRADFPIF